MSDIITLTGNIATEPESRRLPSGVAVTTFRLASSQRRFDRAAERWIDGPTNWYSISTFRALAEHAYQSLHKGERVILTGRLRLRQWENGGRRGLSVEVDAEAIGHDLLWGTSVYSREGGESTGQPSPSESWAPAPLSTGPADRAPTGGRATSADTSAWSDGGRAPGWSMALDIDQPAEGAALVATGADREETPF